jgi:hypothetical protein
MSKKPRPDTKTNRRRRRPAQKRRRSPSQPARTPPVGPIQEARLRAVAEIEELEWLGQHGYATPIDAAIRPPADTKKDDSPGPVKQFVILCRVYWKCQEAMAQVPADKRGYNLEWCDLKVRVREVREQILRAAKPAGLHSLWERDGVSFERASELVRWLRKWRATLCEDRGEAEVDAMSLPDFAVAIRRHERESFEAGERLHFNDDTHTVTLDGIAYKIADPKAYAVYQEIAKNKPNPVTAKKIQEKVPGCLGEKKVRNLLKSLPKPLQATVKSAEYGYWLDLPPAPVR